MVSHASLRHILRKPQPTQNTLQAAIDAHTVSREPLMLQCVRECSLLFGWHAVVNAPAFVTLVQRGACLCAAIARNDPLSDPHANRVECAPVLVFQRYTALWLWQSSRP